MSKALLGKRAEIEVASLDLGDQIAVEWIPMLGKAERVPHAAARDRGALMGYADLGLVPRASVGASDLVPRGTSNQARPEARGTRHGPRPEARVPRN